MSDATWADADCLLDRIAEKVGRTRDEVSAVLTRRGVAFRPTVAIPRRISVTSLRFTGRKSTLDDAVIDFAWTDLEPGLWAVTSDQNLRGKTTLLGVIRWCLTGQRSGWVPRQTLEWFHTVSLSFLIDDRGYEVMIENCAAGVGVLRRLDGPSPTALRQFRSHQEWAGVMSDFFFDQLGLNKILVSTFRDGREVVQLHDWPWLSSALVIDPNPDAVFGTTAPAGLPIRMMQMYLGVPWAGAYADIKFACTSLNNGKRQMDRAVEHTRARREDRLSKLRGEIADLKRTLASLPAEEDLRTRLREAGQQFASAEERARKLSLASTDAQKVVEDAAAVHAEARRALQDLRDGRAAGFVFRALNPVCCPRCDEVFSSHRRERTHADRVCLVCNAPEKPEENPAVREAELQAAVEAARSSLQKARERKASLETERDAAQADAARADAECARLEERLVAPSQQTELSYALAVKEATLAELEREEGPATTTEDADAHVLDVALKIVKDEFTPRQATLLQEVSVLALEYARRFGMDTLTDVSLKGNTHLLCTKGSAAPEAFGACTSGEKVRLKLAATLAILKLAERSGVGRHPGLLLVDSLGSNEVVVKDFEQMVTGLAEVVGEFRHLQVLLAGVHSDVLAECIPANRRVHAAGSTYLW